MKSVKKILALLLILTMAMTLMVACRPSEEEEAVLDTKKGTTTAPNSDNDGTVDQDGQPVNPTDPSTNDQTVDPTKPSTNDQTVDPTNPSTNDQTTDPTKPGTNPGQTQRPGKEIDTTPVTENPLLVKGKAINREAKVSYDLDKTGFVKNTKLSDLKGKTFTLYTGVDYAIWSYYNQSEKYINEWQWFKDIKSVYGCTIKYVRCAPGNNVVRPFQAMSAGKDIDLITTHVASFPYICNILEPLDGYVDMKNFKNSVGLDPQLTEQTKWKGKYICLGATCALGALNYNATYIKSQGLDDPYELFKKGQWTWANFKKYMNGLPATDSQGRKLIGMATWSQYWYWAPTNGKACFEIDGNNPSGGITNNMETPEVKETFVWLEGVCKSSKCTYYNGSTGDWFWGTKSDAYCCMQYGNLGVNVAGIKEDFNKKNRYFWVPFPKNEKNSNAINHVEIYGYGIGIPRKTTKPANRAAAIKFCELWCNRYAEAKFDGLIDKSKFTYEQAMEVYNFGLTNSRFGLGSGVGKLASYASGKDTNFNKSITDASFSTASCLQKLYNYAKQEVANVLKFGVQ